MQRGMGGGEFEPEEQKPDRELTLGPTMLLALGLGLLLGCGLFFALGYRAGRRSPAPAVAALPAAGQPEGSLSKPPAAGMIPAAPAEDTTAEVPQPIAADGSPAGNPLTSYGASGTSTSANALSGQPLVHPALPPQGTETQAASGMAAGAQPSPGQAGPGQAGPGQGAGLMVQIAAVSNPVDANVLVGALRQRGYSVMARREPGDGLIHVQVGPFINRSAANAMCQRLLGDGYNAVVVE